MSSITIYLSDLHFFGRHGVLPQERVTGNDFVVNVELLTEARGLEAMVSRSHEDLAETISYADVYEVVKAQMETPRQLLETVAISTANELRTRFPSIVSGLVSITKVTPPIPGITGSAGVTYRF